MYRIFFILFYLFFWGGGGGVVGVTHKAVRPGA